MSKLVWDAVGKKEYQTGVKELALFEQTNGVYNKGIAWSGVTAVNETPSGGEATDIYADDNKYLSLMSAEKLDATIECYMTPPEFDKYNGEAEVADGMTVGQQDRGVFGIAYTTIKGNDTLGTGYGKVIHALYGCKASPSEQSHSTVNESPEAVNPSYSINTTPVPVTVNGEQKMTASVKIDSTRMTKKQFQAVFDTIFGADNKEPSLPMPDEIAKIITDNAAEG